MPPGIVPKLAENVGFVRNAGEIRRETDSLLEGSGFELPVRGSDKAGCRPFFLRRLLGTGRRADRRAALQLFFIDIDRLTPLALSSKPFDGDPEGAGVVRMATVGPQCGVRNDYG